MTIAQELENEFKNIPYNWDTDRYDYWDTLEFFYHCIDNAESYIADSDVSHDSAYNFTFSDDSMLRFLNPKQSDFCADVYAIPTYNEVRV